MFGRLTLDWTEHVPLQPRSKQADAHKAFGAAREEHFDQIHMPNEGYCDRLIPS